MRHSFWYWHSEGSGVIVHLVGADQAEAAAEVRQIMRRLGAIGSEPHASGGDMVFAVSKGIWPEFRHALLAAGFAEIEEPQ
jgi:hypothetical protein